MLCHTTQGHAGLHQGSTGDRRTKDKAWAKALLWLAQKRQGMAAEAGLGVASL